MRLSNKYCSIILNLYILLDRDKKQFLGYGFFDINLLLQITYLIYIFVIKDKGEDSFHVIGFVATVINIFMYSCPYFNYKKLLTQINLYLILKYFIELILIILELFLYIQLHLVY